MFNYIFLFVWLAYGLFEFIATKKISTDTLNLYVIGVKYYLEHRDV